MNSRGFTLVEQLISIAIIGIVCVFALQVTDAMFRSYSQNSGLERLADLRTNVIALVENDSAWAMTVQNNSSSFACFASGGGCDPAAAPAPFALYNATGDLYFDPSSSTSGLTATGAQCSTFSATGTAACPIRPVLTWKPVCPGGGEACTMPNVQIDATFQLSAGAQIPASTNLSRLNFRIVRSQLTCANQTIDYTLQASWSASNVAFAVVPANIATGAPQNLLITSGSAAAYSAANAATSAATLHACDDQSLIFQQQISVSAGSNATDAANQASVCLLDSATSACDFEWRQTTTTWALWRRDVGGTLAQVYARPPSVAFDAATFFEFRAQKGLVKFFSNGLLAYVFDRPRYPDFKFVVAPPPSNYSLGIAIFPY